MPSSPAYPPTDDPYEAARRLAEAGRNEEAVEAYTRILQRDADHARARYGRGWSLQELGKHALAMADFRELLERFPDWEGVPATLYCRAYTYSKLQQWEQCIAECNRALQLRPSYVLALYLRGTVYRTLENFRAAMDDFNAALAVDPRYWQAYLLRGRMHLKWQVWERVIEDCTALIGLVDKKNSFLREAFASRAEAAMALERYPPAVADYTQAIALDPAEPSAYLKRAECYRKLGEPLLANADEHIGNSLQATNPPTEG